MVVSSPGLNFTDFLFLLILLNISLNNMELMRVQDFFLCSPFNVLEIEALFDIEIGVKLVQQVLLTLF
jgi:hypothetical protein